MSWSSGSNRLIVTNGDCAVATIDAALRGAKLMGWDVLPWRDVLHDGPVPAPLDDEALAAVRARFIAQCGWAEERRTLASFHERDARFAKGIDGEELVLWFEHDLYDQLQLLQLLDRLARGTGPAHQTMIVRDAFVAEQGPETLVDHFGSRQAATPRHRTLGQTGWAAFRAATPHDLAALVAADGETLRPLPYLRAALLRLLAEYPDPRDGLSSTQRRTLEAVVAGASVPCGYFATHSAGSAGPWLRCSTSGEHHFPCVLAPGQEPAVRAGMANEFPARATSRVGDLFAAVAATEEATFMGDHSFWQVVDGLVSAPTPALAMADGRAFEHPSRDLDPESFRGQSVRLTSFGRALLDGRADWVSSNGIDRWLGGVHLTPSAVWRWDRSAQRLIGP